MNDFVIENGVLLEYKGNAEHVVIPDGVTSISCSAFEDNKTLISVTIPSSVTSISSFAFGDCTRLKSIKIPSSVTEIKDYVFDGCTSLENINIPNSVTKIGVAAFRDCQSLQSIKIPSSVTIIEDFAFECCISLTNIEIQNGVKTIGDYVFEDCDSLSNITIPNSVINIGFSVFFNCKNLESITIPNNVTFINDEAFRSMRQPKPQYNKNGTLRAFKAFNYDWTCRDFKYEVGKSYHIGGKIECCWNGFHACTNPLNVFNHYSGYLYELRFAEVELSGKMDWANDKVAASDIRIVRELTISELAEIYTSMEKA